MNTLENQLFHIIRHDFERYNEDMSLTYSKRIFKVLINERGVISIYYVDFNLVRRLLDKYFTDFEVSYRNLESNFVFIFKRKKKIMKASDLRIGNLVYDVIDKKQCYLTLDDFQCMNNYIKSNHVIPYKPIPLTEEILLKCGFDYASKLSDNDCMVYYLDNELEILWTGYLCLDINCSFIPLADTELNHLHQLQNLYYALTGQELEIKL